MAAMEVESRIRKRGQVIQHRHISPPLPSSSQLVGTLPNVSKLRLDSPTRHVLERKQLTEKYNDLQDIEMISSPPSSMEIPGDDEDVTILPSNEDTQETTVTSNVLGASKFRRKQAANTDVSTPVNRGPSTVRVDSRISPSPFDTYDLTQPTSFQLPPTLSPRYQPSTSATIPTTTGARNYLEAHTSSGKAIKISKKPLWKKLQAKTARQTAKREQKEAYYGVDIHHLLDQINAEKGSTPNQYLHFWHF
jgi:hypothetical protein